MKKNIQSKIEEISKKFNAIEEATEETDIIAEVVDDIDTSKYTPDQVMKLNNMVDDFEANRKSLIETTRFGKIMLEKLSQKLVIQDEDINPEYTEMFRVLSETVLNCTKASANLYGEFSKVLVNIKKVNNDKPTKITNNLHVENISTADLIDKLRNNSK